MNFIVPFIGRIVAAIVLGLATWLNNKFGWDIGTDTQGHLTAIGVTVLLALYGVLHKSLNKFFNPGDAASSHLAEREANETERLKAGL